MVEERRRVYKRFIDPVKNLKVRKFEPTVLPEKLPFFLMDIQVTNIFNKQYYIEVSYILFRDIIDK